MHEEQICKVNCVSEFTVMIIIVVEGLWLLYQHIKNYNHHHHHMLFL
jgi:hypothetical protein